MDRYEVRNDTKDKNLLIMLSIFVIVVCIGYWGIYPVVKGIVNTNKEIATQKETQEENELKLTQVPMMEADNERFSNEIQEYVNHSSQ